MGVDALSCPGVSPFLTYRFIPEALKVNAPGNHSPKLDPPGSKIMNRRSIAQSSQMLWSRRGLFAAKHTRDLAPGRDVEEKGTTAQEESSRLSNNDKTGEVGTKETGA